MGVDERYRTLIFAGVDWVIIVIMVLIVAVAGTVIFSCSRGAPTPHVATYQPNEAGVDTTSNDDSALFKELTQFLLDFANQMLVENGSFSPFGGGVHSDGEIVSLGVEIDQGNPQSSIDALAGQLDVGPFDVGMIVVDIRVMPPGKSEKVDAIMLITESRNGFVKQSFLPYKIVNSKVDYGERFDTNESRVIFVGRAKEDLGNLRIETTDYRDQD